ncbi:MAG: hypothetical protein M3R66_19620, partial [Actinomycetota bacterium]|nr:hypothetical protein [Actinomycetota bacterium]
MAEKLPTADRDRARRLVAMATVSLAASSLATTGFTVALLGREDTASASAPATDQAVLPAGTPVL